MMPEQAGAWLEREDVFPGARAVGADFCPIRAPVQKPITPDTAVRGMTLYEVPGYDKMTRSPSADLWGLLKSDIGGLGSAR